MTGSKPSLTVGMGGVAIGVDTLISRIVGSATTEEGAGVTILELLVHHQQLVRKMALES